jgi:hypothetical protein
MLVGTFVGSGVYLLDVRTDAVYLISVSTVFRSPLLSKHNHLHLRQHNQFRDRLAEVNRQLSNRHFNSVYTIQGVLRADERTLRIRGQHLSLETLHTLHELIKLLLCTPVLLLRFLRERDNQGKIRVSVAQLSLRFLPRTSSPTGLAPALGE